MGLTVMLKIVSAALKAKGKVWTFDAKSKAMKFDLETLRGQGLALRTASLSFRQYSVLHCYMY